VRPLSNLLPVRLAFFGFPLVQSRREEIAEARLRALMAAHFDFVWRSLRRLGLSARDADDGAREVFVLASRKLDTLSARSEQRVLFATVLRVAARRRAKSRRAESRSLSARVGSESSSERADEAWRARHDLNEILGAMELEHCAVFMLYELEEMTAPEIAALLEVPVETVCLRLHLAREEFDSALRRLRARASSGAKA